MRKFIVPEAELLYYILSTLRFELEDSQMNYEEFLEEATIAEGLNPANIHNLGELAQAKMEKVYSEY